MDIIPSSSDKKAVNRKEESLVEDIDSWDPALTDLSTIPRHLILEATKRLRSKEVSPSKKTTEKLIQIYHLYCGELIEDLENYEQIPATLIALALDEQFEDIRPMDVDFLIVELFQELSASKQIYFWIKYFPCLSQVQRKTLDNVLSEHRRIREEMNMYLELRKLEKKDFSEDVKLRISSSFLNISTFFVDSSKAVECLQLLHEMNNESIFKYLSELLDWKTDSDAAYIIRELILEKIGVQHPLCGYMERLLVKCSFCIFSYEHVLEIVIILQRIFLSLNMLDRLTHLCASDLIHATELLCMIVNANPELMSPWTEFFPKLLAETSGSISKLLRDMMARVCHCVPSKFSDITSLKQSCVEGSHPESKNTIIAMVSVAYDLDQSTKRKRNLLL